MEEITREKIIEAAKKAGKLQNSPISRADFMRLTGISQYHIYRLFPDGGWDEVKRLAGLESHPKENRPLTDEDLLSEFHRVASELGTIPTWPVFSSRADISADVVRRRFGGLQGTLTRYREWLSVNDASSPLLEIIRAKSKHEIVSPPMPEIISKKLPEWKKTSGIEFGPPIDFRGLRHAPINELGVVFLFGMISYELGFLVEAIHASFPDCEAKRCIDQNRNRWQRVSIEFEYRTSSFQSHGHDLRLCDIIVCWENDWPDCPIEVIELRSVLDRLE
jgi:hypothetical protein